MGRKDSVVGKPLHIMINIATRFILVSIIFLFILSTSATGEETRDEKSFGITGAETPEIYEFPQFTCYVYKKYIVHTLPSQSVGEDIKVFVRSAKGIGKSLCSIESGREAFSIKNSDAFWFAGISEDYLFIDNGTGPDGRNFLIYDLVKKKEIYSSRYLISFALEDKNNLSFYKGKKTVRSLKECPKKYRTKDLQEWMAKGQSVALAEKIILNIKTLKKKNTGEFLCEGLQ